MENLIDFIKTELKHEADAILKVADRIGSNIQDALDLIANCNGKIVVTGMGKTGIIARKIAATLCSTGTTAIFLHAAEGIHGDLGMIENKDIVIAISYSGNTQELVSLIPYLKFNNVPIIALTGNKSSRLAENSDVVLDCEVPKEYEPFGLVPTASTTVILAVGDALAVAMLKKKNFNENDFARFHPGGTIGKKLIYRVSDLMHVGDKNPIVSADASTDEVIIEMTSKGLGCTSVIDKEGDLLGIVTDGDLRRLLSEKGDVRKKIASEIMTPAPKSIYSDSLAVDALNYMEKHKITMLPVIDDEGHPIGILHMHDLINAGVVG